MRLWTDSEETFLKDNYMAMTIKEIAHKLDRSMCSIYHKASRLGLKKFSIDPDYLYEMRVIQKKTLEEIAQKFNTDRNTVARYLDKYSISPTGIRKKILEARRCTPELASSPALAYVLGALKGDGSVTFNPNHRTYRVCLYSKDKSFHKFFRNKAHEIGLCPREGSSRTTLTTVVSNKKFVECYANLSLKDIEGFVSLSKDHVKMFVRGFYDAEGSFTVHKRHGHRYGEVKFTNEDKKLLLLVKNLLKELSGFHSKLALSHMKGERSNYGLFTENCYSLTIWRQGEVTSFVQEIGSSIPRKRGENVDWERGQGGMPWWNEKEKYLLRTLYPKAGAVGLSKVLLRTPKAIRTKAWRLGIVYNN